MRWIARSRWLLARRPWIYWTAVGACALALAAGVASMAADVRHARERWGTTRRVAVATAEIDPGSRVLDAVAFREIPVAALPPSALESVGGAATARHAIAVGEVIVATDVAPAAGPAALLPPGWLAVDVPLNQSSLGEGVALLAVGDPAMVLADGAVVAREATVVAVASGSVAIGVPAAVAPAVAAAASARVAVVALGGAADTGG